MEECLLLPEEERQRKKWRQFADKWRCMESVHSIAVVVVRVKNAREEICVTEVKPVGKQRLLLCTIYTSETETIVTNATVYSKHVWEGERPPPLPVAQNDLSCWHNDSAVSNTSFRAASSLCLHTNCLCVTPGKMDRTHKGTCSAQTRREAHIDFLELFFAVFILTTVSI